MVYAFGRHYQCLEQPDFDIAGHEARHEGASLGNLMKHMFFVLWTIRRLPDFVVRRMSVALAAFVKLKAVSLYISGGLEDVLKRRQGFSEPSYGHCQRAKPRLSRSFTPNSLP